MAITKEQAFASASRVLARGLLKVLSSDPREAAERAYIPKVTPSIDELEQRIREMQAEKLNAAAA